jgi:hypothetical protein
MATYKAEFLSHYYEHKRRPREAYAFGWIDRWARLAAYAPKAVNWLSQTPGLSTFAKNTAGCRISALSTVRSENVPALVQATRKAQ